MRSKTALILMLAAIVLLLLFPFIGHCQIQSKDCPFGDNPKLKFLDSMKNRYTGCQGYIPTEIEFDNFVNLPISSDYTLCQMYVSISGYILEVQPGGVESCNCHSKVNRDTHIYLVKDSTITDKSKAVIVEVTPAFKAVLGTTEAIKAKFKGHYVTVSGFVFQDQEHKENSAIDKGKGLLWRGTTWELHPIVNITLNR